jgi:hypothetical protein
VFPEPHEKGVMGQVLQDCDAWRRMIRIRRFAALMILSTGFSFVLSALVAGPPQRQSPVTRLNPLVSPDESEPQISTPAPKPWSSMGARLIYPYSIIPGDSRSARELKIGVSKHPSHPPFRPRRSARPLPPARNCVIFLDIPHPWRYTGAAERI